MLNGTGSWNAPAWNVESYEREKPLKRNSYGKSGAYHEIIIESRAVSEVQRDDDGTITLVGRRIEVFAKKLPVAHDRSRIS